MESEALVLLLEWMHPFFLVLFKFYSDFFLTQETSEEEKP